MSIIIENKQFATNGAYMKQSSEKSPIVLKNYLAEKATRLLWGNSFYYSSPDEKVEAFLEDFFEDNRFEFQAQKAERVLSSIGRQVVLLDKLKNGKVKISLCNPNYLSRVGKYYEDETNFTGYRYDMQGDNAYIVKTNITADGIREEWFPSNDNREIRLSETNFKLPEDCKRDNKLTKQVKADKGLAKIEAIPVVEMINLPWTVLNPTGMNNGYPDDFSCGYLQEKLDKVWEVLDEELVNNITRVFGQLNEDDIKSLDKGEKNGSDFTKRYFFKTEGVYGQDGAGISIASGDPLLAGYAAYITEIINKYVEFSNYSPEQNSLNKRTEAEALFTKTNDVETTKMKRKLRVLDWMRVIDKALVLGGVWDGVGQRPYAFGINENIVIDELQETNLLIQQINEGLITRLEAIARMRQIDNEEAVPIKEAIDKERQEDMELMGYENGKQEETPIDNQGGKGNKAQVIKNTEGED